MFKGIIAVYYKNRTKHIHVNLSPLEDQLVNFATEIVAVYSENRRNSLIQP